MSKPKKVTKPKLTVVGSEPAEPHSANAKTAKRLESIRRTVTVITMAINDLSATGSLEIADVLRHKVDDELHGLIEELNCERAAGVSHG